MPLMDYPATHSMDTHWFAVDRNGEVAICYSGEAGAVPWDAEYVKDEREHIRWLVDHGGSAVKYKVDDLCTEPDGRIFDAVYDETTAGWQSPTFQPVNEITRPFNQALLWLRSEEPLEELHDVIRLPAGDRVVAHCELMHGLSFTQLQQRGELLRAWVGRALEQWRLGLYSYVHFRHESWILGSGLYRRRDLPLRPLVSATLPSKLRAFLEAVRFDTVRFSEADELQPIEHFVCDSRQSSCVSSVEHDVASFDQGQEPLRRVPGASLILGAALLGFEPEQRPAPPYHLGAPPPRLEAEQKPGLALWLAEQVNASTRERRLTSQLLQPVAAFVATPRRASQNIDVGRSIAELSAEEQRFYRELESLSTERQGESAWVTIARRAAEAALSYFAHRDEMLTTLLMESVWLATELYASGAVTSVAIPDAAAFCRALDDELLRREGIGLVVNKTGEPPPAVRRVLWRGASSGGGMVWIAALEPEDRLGVLVRSREDCLWIVGDRDTVLASVPDPLFEEATEAVLAACLESS